MIKFAPGEWLGLDTMGDEELARLREPAALAVHRAALHFEGAVKKTLSGKRSGRIYRVSRKGRLHQASAPGEPPAVMFGALRQSITSTEPVWDGWQVSCEVGTNLVYARRLEWGGVDRRGIRILPRPYFEPTFVKEEENINAILEEAVA